MNTLYIIIPAYNEEQNIEMVVKEWYQIIERVDNITGHPNSRLVIIDDGSKDLTFNKLEYLSKSLPKLIPLSKKNEGHGATVLYGFNYALQAGANYIFQTDSDGQTLPEEFWNFWDKRNDYDVIIGYRQHRQDGMTRVIVTKVLKFTVFFLLGVWVKDANTPFRLLNSNILKRHINKVPSNYNLANVLLSAIFIKNKEKVLFLPITFRPRQGGKNSINVKNIFTIGIKTLNDFLTLRNKM